MVLVNNCIKSLRKSNLDGDLDLPSPLSNPKSLGLG